MAVSYTTVGRGRIVDCVQGNATATGPGTATEWYVMWGTGGSGTLSTATASDVALVAEATETRIVPTLSQPAADTNQWLGTITNQKVGGKTIEEVAILTATAGGVCVIRSTFGAVAVATGDSIQFTVTLQQT